MQGRTHLVIGTAIAAALRTSAPLPVLLTGCCAAAVGSLIPDLDADGSKGNRGVSRVAAMILIIFVLTVLLDTYAHLSLYEEIRRQLSGRTGLIAALIFLFICGIGLLGPHRSVMHSITAGCLLSACVYVLLPDAWACFAAGFASHLFLDLLNSKGLPLFFPLKKRYSLKLFRAGGWVDHLLFLAGSVMLVLLTAAHFS